MAKQEAKRGRPPGKEFSTARTLLLTPDDDVSLNALAELWGCSAAAAVRRLIRERAADAGLTGSDPARARDARPRLDDDTLRRAAELAKEYYETDPEALELAAFPGDTIDE
jgi:hypothetical protein